MSMSYMATVSSRGQISIPAALRQQFELEEGTQISFVPEGEKLVMMREASAAERLADLHAYFGQRKPKYASDEEAITAYFQQSGGKV